MTRHPRIRAPAFGAAAVLTLALSGCLSLAPSGHPPPNTTPASATEPEATADNGLTRRSGDDARQAIVRAIARAETFTMVGAFIDTTPTPRSAKKVTFTVATTAGSVAARLTHDEREVVLVRSRTEVRFRANAAWASAAGMPDVANRVMCPSPKTTVFDDWRTILNPADLFAMVLDGLTLAVKPIHSDGSKTEITLSRGSADIGTLRVARFGPPLPADVTTTKDGISMKIATLPSGGQHVESALWDSLKCP